ncbi:growth hormone-inducible transmembrane protein-like [Belonocnema kinseyi]|uniref:growth hormone-inducible transmembrane protein-like n=1 Tax=Belonocnema kinseyi TaxID=2817044 RepID=UPI00143CC379|nr:growth hormone-inducible transmembrane protein-like [Belonocnema kinseyi]XP_033208494.1 growth hormone-inducible transmembrane protein-like [Belonocnema kinseyi]
MLILKVCRSSLSPQVTSLLKAPKTVLPRAQVARLFASDGRQTFTRSARARESLVEKVAKPAGETAFNIGKGAVAGASALGLGALCFYGLGLSSETGAIDHAQVWPQYVKDRIRSTYMYTAASVAATVASAAMVLRSPAIMRAVSNQGFLALALTMGSLVLSSAVVQNMPYEGGFTAKHVAWLIHTGIVGAIFAPLYFMGGALVLRAGVYTAGIVGGLSTLAACAPSEKFLTMGGPLAIGFGVVFASSMASFFVPPTTVLGSGLYSMALYGGLILFSMFLLYDTQKVIKKAETYPKYNMSGHQAFDPINNALHIYTDIINIFIRVLSILGGGGGRKK